MTSPSSDVADPAPPDSDAAAQLASILAEEMIERWRRGERPLPEDFLNLHPQLWKHPEAAADLIYEELCLRQEHGAEVPFDEVLRRFPQWQPQLEILFDCERLLGPRPVPPEFPAPGESLGDFLLLAELGRGAQARVFLASQLSLADRPVVLKLTPTDGREHLSLARLQHTYIVPLYSVQDHPARRLRALCMPYFGGATLAQLFDRLRHKSRKRARDRTSCVHSTTRRENDHPCLAWLPRAIPPARRGSSSLAARIRRPYAGWESAWPMPCTMRIGAACSTST